MINTENHAPWFKNWFTLATEAESESEESSDLVWIGTTEAES